MKIVRTETKNYCIEFETEEEAEKAGRAIIAAMHKLYPKREECDITYSTEEINRLKDKVAAQAKEIEQLKARLADFRWRPVSESPPEAGWYFIRYKEGDTGYGFWGDTKWKYCSSSFTHWMPMSPL